MKEQKVTLHKSIYILYLISFIIWRDKLIKQIGKINIVLLLTVLLSRFSVLLIILALITLAYLSIKRSKILNFLTCEQSVKKIFVFLL